MEYQKADKITIFDKFFKYTILWAIPKSVTPNQVTIFRFICVPFVIYFLFLQEYAILIPLFTIAALSDAIDGAMARTRDQVTDLGKIIDPIADKLLIVSSAIILVTRYIGPFYTFLIILSEIVILLGAIYQNKLYGAKIEAQLVGKLKMIFQSFGIGFLILHSAILGFGWILIVGQILIAVSVLFAFLSIFVYKSI
jgi:CDP-diacylglycerol--glycerol-3-phosphate 3-phosphatidyltransferase